MKFTPTLLLATSIILLSGCARMNVACKTEPGYDFSQIKTYQWVAVPEEILEQNDIYLNEDMQKALNNELAARGWRQVLDKTNATVQVACYFEIKAHREYAETVPDPETEFAGGLVYKTGSHKWNYEERGPDANVYTVEVGTLNVPMDDVASTVRVWHGTLETKIDRSQPPEKQRELFRQMAHKLMEHFPAGAK